MGIQEIVKVFWGLPWYLALGVFVAEYAILLFKLWWVFVLVGVYMIFSIWRTSFERGKR